MNAPRDRRSFPWSEALYQRLLRLYPARHRAEYGDAMTQLFRDQCRDACQESPAWGMLALWLRTLSDLANTSLMERLAALKKRKNMNDKLTDLFAFRASPASTFLRVFVLVFLVVFGASAVITFLLPDSYASTARLKVENPAAAASAAGSPTYVAYDPYFIQTTFEIMQSELVLSNVIARLDLNKRWAKLYFNGQRLDARETMELLRRRLRFAPVKNTQLIAITAYSQDAREAAQIANAVANSYRDYRHNSSLALDQQTGRRLDEESRDQQDRIQSLETKVADWKAKYGIVEDDAALEAAAAAAAQSVRTKTAELEHLRPLSAEDRRQVLPMLFSDALLNDLLGKLNDAHQKYVMLTNDFAQSTPDVARVSALINELNRELDQRVGGIMNGLEAQLALDEATAEALAKKIRLAKPTAETQPYWVAKQELEQVVTAHQLLTAKLENLKMDTGITVQEPVQITDVAEPGLAPVKPNKPLNLVVGAGLGAILGAFAGALALPFAFRRRPAKPALAA